VESRHFILAGIALFFVLSAPTAGLCAEGKGFSLNLWPLFTYRSDSEGARSKLRILGPLIYRRKGAEEGEFALRPLFYWIKNGREDSLSIEYLYPLGKFKREDGYTRNYIVPFHSAMDEKRWERGESHFSLFLHFQGQAEGGERYWGVFPLYGHLVDRFGRDRIRFYLWPIYSDTNDEGTYTWTFLWPILSSLAPMGLQGRREDFQDRFYPVAVFYQKGGGSGYGRSRKGVLPVPPLSGCPVQNGVASDDIMAVLSPCR
jgi:hypothetical protein